MGLDNYRGLPDEKRFIRTLPGRVRLGVCGLKRNIALAHILERVLRTYPGVIKVSPCVDTGRVLIVYDEARTGLSMFLAGIEKLEAQTERSPDMIRRTGKVVGVNKAAQSENSEILQSRDPSRLTGMEGLTGRTQIREAQAPGVMPSGAETGEAAATADAPVIPYATVTPELSTRYARTGLKFGGVPLALAISIGGLGVLTLKQVSLGKSTWTKAPGLFYWAALVSILRDYPLFRRQLETVSKRSKLRGDPDRGQTSSEVPALSQSRNSGRSPGSSRDMRWRGEALLGAATLGLALVRENLVVLAGIGLIQYLHWQMERNACENRSEMSGATPEIHHYAERTGRQDLALAAGTWVLTGDPGRSVGVLLAGSPRVASVPAQYAWEQAELTAREKGYFIPEHTSLAQLARVKHAILTDSVLLRSGGTEEIVCVADPENEDKVWHLAASLMKKIHHPWLERVSAKALPAKGTIRTAFKVERGMDGVKGSIQGSEVMLGSLEYLQACGVNCDSHLLDINRRQRTGHEVLCLAQEGNYLGILTRYQGEIPPELAQGLSGWRAAGIKVGILENSLNLPLADLEQYGIDKEWTGRNAGVWETIAAMYEQGEEILFVGTGENLAAEKGSVPQPGREGEPGQQLRAMKHRMPHVPVDQISNLNRSLSYAGYMNQVVNQHLQAAKLWNYAGAGLAALGVMTAPMANLLTDALTLTLMANSKRHSEKFDEEAISLKDPIGSYAGSSPSPASFANSASLNSAKSAGLNSPSPKSFNVSASLAGSIHTSLGSAHVWSTLSEEEILHTFAVREGQGLQPQQVDSLRKQYGLNQLEPKRPKPWLLSYLSQFTEFTTLIVLGTSVLALVTGAVFDGLAMGTILLANAAIGTLQERKAERVIDALNQFQPPSCRVLRGGRELEVMGTELLSGDIVKLEAGDRVPADLRLLQSWNLEANESALTGESVPVVKNSKCLPGGCPLAEQSNMLFMGTDITRGKGSGIVVGTGMQTEIGHLMLLMKDQDKVTTPLHEKVTSISKTFVKGAALAGGLVLVVGLLRGRPLTEMITTSITLAASAVPEGLPVTITIALSAGIYRMAKHNALIRKLSALETLGRTTIICTDKTGTLTKNEMTVTQIVTPSHTWKVTGEGYQPTGKIVPLPVTEVASSPSPDKNSNLTLSDIPSSVSEGISQFPSDLLSSPELVQLAKIALLCNNSQLEQEGEEWAVKGDPTEGALLTLAAKVGFRLETMRHWHRVHEIPFDSQAGTMSVVCRDTKEGENCFVFCKGSVEAVLQRCSHYQEEGVIRPLTAAKKELIYRQNEKLAREALRVLGFAYCPTEWVESEASSVSADDELIYVGLVGMMDPPKPEVEESIREAYALGVKPVMITGDHPITALAIARDLGIGGDHTRVLTGQELDRLSDEELSKMVEKVGIFARVTPEHKLRIVKAYQKAGHIVAMTGDGVNDTPAIKQSNVGIAMGRTGTEVTKATADMVLKKDHFGSILEGVKEGRTIIANMRKAIGCLLTGNLAEILVTATAVIAGLPMPLVPIQILLMNLLTDAIPAMILAVNPGSGQQYTGRQDIVDKRLYQKVVTRGILLGAGALGLFGLTIAAGAPLAVAQTVAFTSLVLGQLGQTFSWHQEGSVGGTRESLKDRYLVGSLAVSFLALVGAIYIPPVAGFFHTAPLQFQHWMAIFLLAGTVSLLAKPFLALVARREDGLSQSEAGGRIGVLVKSRAKGAKGWQVPISPLMAGR